MTLDNLTIKTCDDCSIILEENLEDYASESSSDVLFRNFKYSDTISIDLIIHDKLKESEVTKSIVYTKHDTLNPIKVRVPVDGTFSIVHIVLPSKEWYLRQLTNNSQVKSQYQYLYYSDGKKIYQGFLEPSKDSIEIPIDVIVDFNDNLITKSTIFKISKKYVSICFLRKCYVNLCQQIFDSRTNTSCNNKNINEDLIYRRDFVWMAINVIKYLTEMEQLQEVERIVEILLGCNGICQFNNNLKINGNCGCSK